MVAAWFARIPANFKKEKQSASAAASQTLAPEKAANIDEQQLAQVQAAVMPIPDFLDDNQLQ